MELGVISIDSDGYFIPGDVRRASLMKTLESSGLPLEGMAVAIRDGQLSLGFLDGDVYDRFGTIADVTFEELSGSIGVPVDLLMVIREAIGYAEPQPTDRVRESELQITPLVQAQIESGFRPAAIERWLRVYGESMQRIVETEVDWWHTEVELPFIDSGMSPGDIMDRAEASVTRRVAPHLDDALLGLYHGHQEHAWTESVIFGIEGALNQAGVFSRLDRMPAICFLDLAGYTRLTEQQGDQAAAEMAARLGKLVRRSSAEHNGKPIKWLGDGVMFFFREPGQAVLSALEMVGEAQSTGLPPAHVGIHTGPVLFQEGDYFGQTVNVASRIADYARPGEVLVSQDVVDSASSSELTFTAIGPVELKGLTEPMFLHSAHRTLPL